MFRQILFKKIDILIIFSHTLQNKLPPPSYIMQSVFIFNKYDKLSLEQLKKYLILSNYTHVHQILDAGEFSIRGGIIDIMPMINTKNISESYFIRLELFDDEIENIQKIALSDRHVIANIEQFELLPIREFPTDQASLQLFNKKFNTIFKSHTLHNNELILSGSEFYLPLFFDNIVSLFDYLVFDKTSNWQIIYYDNLNTHLLNNDNEITRRYNISQHQYPCLPPEEIFINTQQIFNEIQQFTSININKQFINNNIQKSLQTINDIINAQNQTIILVISSIGRIEIIREYFESNYNIKLLNLDKINELYQLTEYTKQIYIIQANLYNSFITNKITINSHKFVFLNDADLKIIINTTNNTTHNKNNTNSTINANSKTISTSNTNTNSSKDELILDLSEIKIGNFVVHIKYGIGKYLGLSTIKVDDVEHEMLELEYQNDAKLFIPINNLNLIAKYSKLDTQELQVSNLGSNAWNKIKTNTIKKITDLASSLLDLYATRKLNYRDKFTIPEEYAQFANSFGYEPTMDQVNSFNDILHDMQHNKPMDRLICGDVGFGKTEVAIRAAFICAMNGKQVAFLTPTTLLAEQHYLNFIDRFANYPIKIVELSRFKTKKEILETIDQIKAGKVDIVIGTNRVIQDDVIFANLGLVIIDEEHRFGVKQKEKFKHLRNNVDILAMTATPIPRTLSMALDGLREFSIIATAPKKRLPINTIVCDDDNEFIKDAILREIRRSGQVFFLYNEVASIEEMYNRLKNLLPNLSIVVAHGQLKSNILEERIHDFIKQKFNILLCSTIIETGIDIPNANTIIIYNANNFGLSQLHQLRGRVGRSHHQAYCYLIIKNSNNLNKEAQMRIDAIRTHNELGSGFNLAIHDLEIRGAGEILGDNQSGNIKDVGIVLYTRMLTQAIKYIKSNQKNKLASETSNNIKETNKTNAEHNGNNIFTNLDVLLSNTCEINLNITAIITNDYMQNINERLIYYKQFANATTSDEVDLIYQNIINIYGLPNDALKALVQSNHIRIKATLIDIKKIDVTDKKISLSFKDKPNINPENIVRLLQNLKNIKIDNNKIIWHTESSNLTNKVKLINELLDFIM